MHYSKQTLTDIVRALNSHHQDQSSHHLSLHICHNTQCARDMSVTWSMYWYKTITTKHSFKHRLCCSCICVHQNTINNVLNNILTRNCSSQLKLVCTAEFYNLLTPFREELRRWSLHRKTKRCRNTGLFSDQERGRDLNDSSVTALTAVLSRDDITWTKSCFPLKQR